MNVRRYRSRALTFLGALGATLSTIAVEVGKLNVRWGGALVLVGLALTTFNERIHGGASWKRKAHARQKSKS